MIITKIEIKEFGRHKHVLAEDLGAVTGLLGANGSGKSTILAAVEFAFTGQLRDNQETYVRGHGTEGGANNASVLIEFIKNGQPGSIFRQVGKTAKRKLEWQDQEWTKTKEVDELMSDILGADKLALSNAIFINQGELDRLLFGTPGERQDLFTRLMLISYIEQRQYVLDNKIKALGSGLQDFTVMLDESRQTIREAQIELKELEDKKQELRDYTPSIDLWKELEVRKTQKSDAYLNWQSLNQQLLECQQRVRQVSGAPDADLQKLDAELQTLAESRDAAYRKWQDLDKEVRAYQAYQGLAERVEEERESLKTQEARYTALLSELGHDSPQSLGKAVEDLEQRQAAWQEYDRQAQKLQVMEEDYQQEAAKHEELKALKVPYSESEIEALRVTSEELQKQVFSKEAELRTLTKARELLDSGKSGECPVCHSTLSDSQLLSKENLSKLRDEVQMTDDLWETADKDYQSAKVDVTKHRNALEQAQTESLRKMRLWASHSGQMPPKVSKPDEKLYKELSSGQARVDALNNTKLEQEKVVQRREQELDALPCPDVDPQTSEKARDQHKADYEQMQDQYAEKEGERKKLALAFTELSNAQAKHDQAKDKMDKEVDTLTSVQSSVDNDRVLVSLQKEVGEDPYREVLTLLQERQREFGEIQGRIGQSQSHLENQEKKLRDLEERRDRDARRRDVLDNLRTLRGAMAKDGVPASYIRYRFERLVEVTQSQLSELDANFTVEADPEAPITFRFKRLDEVDAGWMDQSKLSGGQRVRLTVAFLLAVQRLVIPEVGFLVLDEPSQHLDESGVESLKELLMRLQQTLGSAESQVLVCDHRPELATAFSSVLRLN